MTLKKSLIKENKLIYILTFVFILLSFNQNLFGQEYRIFISDFKAIGGNLKLSDGKIIGNSIRNAISEQTDPQKINILERESLTDIIKEVSDYQKFFGIYDKKYAIEVGKILQANYVIFGQIAKSEELYSGGINISARIVNIETGVIISAREETYYKGKGLSTTIKRICRDLVDFMGIEYDISFSDKECLINTLNIYQNNFNSTYQYGNDLIVIDNRKEDFSSKINGFLPIGKLKSNSEIIGVISNDSKYSSKNGKMTILITNEGINWKFSQSQNCSKKYKSKYENSGGMNWEELKNASFSIKEIEYTYLSRLEPNSIGPAYRKEKEFKKTIFQLLVNDIPLILDNSCFKSPTIFEIKNILTQLKACDIE